MRKDKNDVIFYKIIRPLVKGFTMLVFHPKIVGKENITENGRLVLAGNHTSIFDCLLLVSSTKREIHFLAKDELWRGPKKIIFANLGLIPVNRRTKDPNALTTAIEYLNSDNVIGIFPEGTIEKKKGEFLPFKIGAVKMASVTSTQIVPFAITGNYHIFSRNLTIKFGKPFYVDDKDLVLQNKMLQTKIDKLKKGDK